MIERVALSDDKNIMKARGPIRKALEIQREGTASRSSRNILCCRARRSGERTGGSPRWVSRR